MTEESRQGRPEGFTQRFHVRFDECAPGRDGPPTARSAVLLRYTIETAFGHSAALDYPLAWYDAHGLYWLVRRADLWLHRSVPYGAAVAVTTRVAGFRRIWARRHNHVHDAAGTLLAEITMDWIFTDRDGRPARVPSAVEAAFPALQERLAILRVVQEPPPADAWTAPYHVPPHALDPRGHVNTAVYLELFEDVLADRGVDAQARPARYQIEFLRPALLGETLERSLWQGPSGWEVLMLTGGEPAVRARRDAADRPGQAARNA